jgi:hypothetical protein
MVQQQCHAWCIGSNVSAAIIFIPVCTASSYPPQGSNVLYCSMHPPGSLSMPYHFNIFGLEIGKRSALYAAKCFEN